MTPPRAIPHFRTTLHTRHTGGSRPDNFIPFQGDLYFSADDGIHGYEIWRLAPDLQF